MVFCSQANITSVHVMHARHHVTSLLNTLSPSLAYHHKEHTLGVVVPVTKQLAITEGCSHSQVNLLMVAALFHDVGYTHSYENNEEYAAQKVFYYMQRCPLPYTYEQAKIVQEAILATNLSTTPYFKHEKIMRDADLSALGREDFWYWSKALQTEITQYHPAVSLHIQTDKDWLQFEYQFLATHRWQTKSAHTFFEKGKQENMRVLKRLISKSTSKPNQPTQQQAAITLFERNLFKGNTAPQRPVF